jgi:hypothetical protein
MHRFSGATLAAFSESSPQDCPPFPRMSIKRLLDPVGTNKWPGRLIGDAFGRLPKIFLDLITQTFRIAGWRNNG